MRVLLDACVLFPTVVREMLFGMAGAGLFTPFWSARIVAEWQRAVQSRLGPVAGLQAEGEAALMAAGWPGAGMAADPELEAQLWLPDPADRHVLAAAIAGRADLIVTFNLRDFPARVLAEHGLSAAHPDGFLLGLARAHPGIAAGVAAQVTDKAARLGGAPVETRALLKKARLSQLGKFLTKQL